MKVHITEKLGVRLVQAAFAVFFFGFLAWLAFFAPAPPIERDAPISNRGTLTVREVELPQGSSVQCVVFEYPYYPRPGGISCDWDSVR